VEGERAYLSVLDYPGEIDEATVYVQPSVGVGVMRGIVKKGGSRESGSIRRGHGGHRGRAPTGLSPRVACSIVGIGDSPGRY
jgi:hypothetical protein